MAAMILQPPLPRFHHRNDRLPAMPALLMETISSPRPRGSVEATTRFAACLQRLSAVDCRLVVTAPSDWRTFTRGVRRFPDRRIEVGEHARWEAAYRTFARRTPAPHEAGSWRIMAVDRDDQVIGAITARFFCGEVVLEHLHVLSLLESTGPVFREHCELAVGDVLTACGRLQRTPAEISHWAVAPGWHAALVAVTLSRAMGALVAAFDAPLVLMAADNRRGESARLMRLGGAPLGLAGRFSLPPFVHHASGAWVRLLLVDAPTFHVRSGAAPASDLALLREHAAIVSVA